DIFLDELQDKMDILFGHRPSIPIIWRTLRRAGYRMKKVTRAAAERSVRKRAEYTMKIGTRYLRNMLVFVDESAANRRTTYRGYAWAIRGRRAVRKCYFVRGKRYAP
ncbi:hypothetical protein PENSPDRAFT_553637, partial [Peniophora sp. CONT]